LIFTAYNQEVLSSFSPTLFDTIQDTLIDLFTFEYRNRPSLTKVLLLYESNLRRHLTPFTGDGGRESRTGIDSGGRVIHRSRSVRIRIETPSLFEEDGPPIILGGEIPPDSAIRCPGKRAFCDDRKNNYKETSGIEEIAKKLTKKGQFKKNKQSENLI